MHSTIIQLFASADTDAAAVVDMPDDGKLIRAVGFISLDTLAVDGDGAFSEISFGSTSAFTSNDARQVIATIGAFGQLVGVGANFLLSSHQQAFDFGAGIAVFAGERIYLHNAAVGATPGSVGRAIWQLCIEFKSFSSRRR